MTGRSIAILVATLLAFGHGAPRAQSTAPPLRSWSMSLAIGGASGLSRWGVERLMKASGFDDQEGCMFWCDGSPRNTPHSDLGGRNLQVAVRRRLGPSTHVRALLSRSMLSVTTGYRNGAPDVQGGYLILEQSVVSAGLLLGTEVKEERGFYVAGGPSVFRVKLEDPEFHDTARFAATTLGVIGTAGFVAAPSGEWYFVELQGQIFLMPTVVMKPTSTQYVGPLPRAHVNFSHGTVTLGVGLRL